MNKWLWRQDKGNDGKGEKHELHFHIFYKDVHCQKDWTKKS